MKQEIKLRAWDKHLKLMREVTSIDLKYKEVFYLIDNEATYISRSFSEVEIMQSTGLHDKNGVEIYDGDVLDFTVWDAWDNDTQYIGVVKFEQGEWQIWNSEQSEFYDADGAFNLFWVHENDTKIKVIGNIHENMELLEVGR